MGRITGFLALRRGVVGLLFMLVLVGLGEKLFQRFLPHYLSALGAGPLVIGVFGFLENGLGALYALPGGHLTDRLGHRRSLMLFALLNLVGYALLAVHDWRVALAAMFMCTAWSQLSLPATLSMVSRHLPRDQRTMGLAVQGIVRRIPMALGPVLGGAVFTALGVITGMRWVLLASGVLTVVGVMVQIAFTRGDADEARDDGLGFRDVVRSIRPELRQLLLSDILVRFCEQIPNAFVVLWVLDRMHRSELEFGWLTAIEMATAAALYIPVASWVDARVRKVRETQRAEAQLQATERGPFIVMTFLFFTAFPLVLLVSHSWWGLVLAFLVRGLKEFGEPARKATIVDLAAEGLKARTVGVYYFFRDSTVALAALGGGWLWQLDPRLNLLTAAGFGLLGTLVCLRLTRAGRV